MSEFSIKTHLLSSDSQNYLREIYSLPFAILPEKITFDSLRIQGKDPEAISTILNRLINMENDFKIKCRHLLTQAQTHLKKINKWGIGVSLFAILLSVSTILCFLFFPPAAAFIQPLSLLLGKGVYGILLVADLLPTLGLGIAKLFNLSRLKKLQRTLAHHQGITQQLVDALQNTESLMAPLENGSISHPSSSIDFIKPISPILFAVPKRNSNIFTVDHSSDVTTNDDKSIDEVCPITYRNSI
ncbi:hypothetical protein [Rickettsiella grylli]|uniref:Uncharacterized protein n=1 Tax=Rickettsiella grylli TaxID=59196 RepID=A8PLY4_9COXI|nr:hypothetical protein [Rickettsiella grylli]EDP46589.1 hypothetical protein RICGR_0574 [Rickettsiella grylli]